MSTILRTAGQITGVSLMLAPIALVGTSAFAAPACQTTTPAATTVSPGICEVAFTEAGDYTFTAPSGIAKLQAVVVGGGAAAWVNYGIYAGGGGDVAFFDDVDISAPVEITVGAGGLFDDGLGGDSGINGDVVYGGGESGGSGNNNLSVIDTEFGAGAGAGGDALSESIGGSGVTASDIAVGSDLFPAVAGEPEFGAGGDAPSAYNVEIGITPNVPGHGGNGRELVVAGPNTSYFGDDGIDGAVYLRWSTSLAATGVDTAGLTAGAVTLVAGGAIVLATRRRSQRA